MSNATPPKPGANETRLVLILFVVVLALVPLVYWEQQTARDAESAYENDPCRSSEELRARRIERREPEYAYAIRTNAVLFGAERAFTDELRQDLASRFQRVNVAISDGDFESVLAELAEQPPEFRCGDGTDLAAPAVALFRAQAYLLLDRPEQSAEVLREGLRIAAGQDAVLFQLLLAVAERNGRGRDTAPVDMNRFGADWRFYKITEDSSPLSIRVVVASIVMQWFELGRVDLALALTEVFRDVATDLGDDAERERQAADELLARLRLLTGELDRNDYLARAGATADASTDERHWWDAADLLFEASLHQERGQLDAAEPLIAEALELASTDAPPGNFAYLNAVNLRARQLLLLGDEEGAIAVQKSALDGVDLAGDFMALRLADELAILLTDLGRPDEALPYLERADAALAQRGAPNSPRGATHALAAATVAASIGNFDEARQHLASALSIGETFGPDSYFLGTILLHAASITLAQMGAPEEAEPLAEAAVAILTQVSEADFVRLQARLILGMTHLEQGQCDAARAQFGLVYDDMSTLVTGVVNFATQQEIDNFGTETRSLLSLLLSVATACGVDAAMPRETWDTLLLAKELSLRIAADRHRALWAADDPEIADLSARLTVAQQRARATRPAESTDASSADVAAEREALESELVAALAQRGIRVDDLTRFSTVTEALPDDATLIELVRFEDVDGDHYAALFWHGELVEPELRLLGEAEAIDAAVVEWRSQLRGGAASAPAASRVRALVWDPLSSALRGEKVVLSTDGPLSLVAFGALPTADGTQFLAERYVFSYLGSSADMVEQASTNSTSPTVLIGAPNYDAALEEGSAAATESRRFAALSGAEREVDEIAKIVADSEPLLLKGDAATEHAVRALRAPKVLHFATHGFFADGDSTPPLASRSQSRGFDPVGGAPELVGFDDPYETGAMHRSGLALAGANNSGSYASGDGLDGILTAQEVSEMNLIDTRLVVLSACDTGLGAVVPGQGVYGLRRAFAIAGAQRLVLALWSIPDEETKNLMVDLYSHRALIDDPASALTAVQRRWIEDRRNRGIYPDPYLWGAFVASGNFQPYEG
jgi:CHAT domain-containing protein/tetratricopeptide (TPR) repeat protein